MVTASSSSEHTFLQEHCSAEFDSRGSGFAGGNQLSQPGIAVLVEERGKEHSTTLTVALYLDDVTPSLLVKSVDVSLSESLLMHHVLTSNLNLLLSCHFCICLTHTHTSQGLTLSHAAEVL